MARSQEALLRRMLKKKSYVKDKKKNDKHEMNNLKERNELQQKETEKVVQEKQKVLAENEKVEEEKQQAIKEKENVIKENEMIEEKNQKLEAEKQKLILEKEKVLAENKQMQNFVNTTQRKLVSMNSKCLSSFSKQIIRGKEKHITTTTHNNLSEDVVEQTNISIGSGTFGEVKIGRMRLLNIECAIKIGKSIDYFNANHEASILQCLQNSKYFPHLFGILHKKKIVMEYVKFNESSMTVYKARREGIFNQDKWTQICYDMLNALIHMHRQNILHNDLKNNNVLIRSNSIPVIIDFGKATLRNKPEIYNLTAKQRERYNSNHPYLAYELRNLPCMKTSVSTDIFSLGYIYNFVADKDNEVLQDLQRRMQTQERARRITSVDSLKIFKHWAKKSQAE
ncbi:uncharacterized protein [Clytia hemisphaerica]|uniref:uncharacterized protein n=1 Tax=Clytia hemisphaerica TaxID=252671 RepID=UPI0034D59B4E